MRYEEKQTLFLLSALLIRIQQVRPSNFDGPFNYEELRVLYSQGQLGRQKEVPRVGQQQELWYTCKEAHLGVRNVTWALSGVFSSQYTIAPLSVIFT